MKMSFSIILFSLLVTPVFSQEDFRNEIDLAGSWILRLDPDDAGITETWYKDISGSPIRLPGSLQSQGFGNDVTIKTEWTGAIVDRSWFLEDKYAPYRQPGNIKLPFWLTPDKHYVGAAWYQREVDIPDEWENRPVELILERCHWQSTVWVDEAEIGHNESLSVPHRYDVSEYLTPGKHRLTIRIDNRLQTEVGENAHSVSDHTQTNWNGIIGDIKLVTGNRLCISDIQIFPDSDRRRIKVLVDAGNWADKSVSAKLILKVSAQGENSSLVVRSHEIEFTAEQKDTRHAFELEFPGPVHLWDEFNPHLYRLTAQIVTEDDHVLCDEKKVVFGMRSVATRGTQIMVNDRPVFLRGTLECCIFPETGYPPADVESWERIIRICKAHGLNHIRFHSWCPPEAAFEVADRLGFYYQVECAAWTNDANSTLGDGKSIDQWIYEEGDRILAAYGNHPSFLLMAYGNEPGGKNQNAYLGELVSYWKSKDSRRLYTSGAGWPMIPENDYHNTPDPRIQGWGAGLNSRINSRSPETVTDYRDYISGKNKPVISHEIGQWCVYPNFAEISKYTGLLKAKNFEIFRDDLTQHHMLDEAENFLMASGKLQALCYKEEIESALRTPGMGGFQLLDLHDFPGQGSALVGVLDPFWDEKGYITAGEYHRFACETVPLARMKKRTWTTADTFYAKIEIAHYGPGDFSGNPVTWSVRNTQGQLIRSGSLNPGIIATGKLNDAGPVSMPLNLINAPSQLNLEVALKGTGYANDWDFWVFPVPGKSMPGEVFVTHELNEEAVSVLRNGGSVFFLPKPGTIKGDKYGPIPAGFSSIFWNTAWTRRQAPHTLGILCDPGHPALGGFPTEFHSNWQWWDLVTKAHPFIIDDLPVELRPVIQVVDDWFTNRRLALAFEARVESGKLLACGIDLENDHLNRPVAAQLKKSILAYMNSDRFAPSTLMSVSQVKNLITPPLVNKASGKKLVLEYAASPRYNAGGEDALVDGLLGTADFGDGRWQGFEGDDLLATIDLGELTIMESVTVNFLRSQGSWIFFPEKVRILKSGNGDDFQELLDENWGVPTDDSRPLQKSAIVAWKGSTRYIRIEARNIGNCPAWHPGAGGKAWIFADEIIIQ